VPVGDKNSRVYQRIAQTLPIRYNFPTTMPMNILKNNGADDISLTADWDITEFAHNTLLSLFAPAAVLINDRYEILYFNGPVRKFIAPPSGQISMDFVSWLPEALRNKMRGTLYNASQSEKKVSAQVVMPDVNGKEHSIVLSIQRHKHPMHPADIFLVTFSEHVARLSEETVVIQGAEADQAAILQLERELNITREAMQTNTEELQSANEELKSANEELQASNEEMDTSREELQSLNEELSTINSQLQTALEQQDATNNDLLNFMSSTNIPTLFLDESFNVRRYTPAMTNLIKLLPTDIGRPLFDMSYGNLGPRIAEVAESVLKNLAPVKEEIRIGSIWYQRSMLPYRTADNRIEGVVISYIDINERRKMEEEIELLARFPAENPSPILRISKDGIVLYANAASGPLLNTWNCTTLCAASDDIRTMIAQTFEGKLPKHVEIECNDRIFAFDVVPLIDAGYVNMYGKDITLRRQTENNLQESLKRNEFLANVIELSTQPFGVGYPDGRLGLINKAFEELTGYSSEELHTLDWAKVLTPPEWVDSETQKLAELQATGIPVRYEKEYIRKNGTRVPIELLVHIKKDAEGNSLYYYSFVTDISERKKAEEELRESQYRLEAIFATIPDLIVEYDAKGALVRTNKAELVVTGLNPLNLTSEQVTNAAQILKLDGKPLSVKDTPTVRALKGEIIQNEQYSIKNADGTERVVTTFAAPLYKNGMVSGVVAFLHDITNIKRAEEALRESESRYHGLFDTMEEGFCIVEMIFDAKNKPVDYRFLEVNAAFEKLTGLHDASGKLMRELEPAHEDVWFETYGNIALTGEPAQFVNEAAALNRWFQVTAYRVGKPEQRQVAIIFSDISELKAAEIKLRESNAEMERFNRAAIDREIRMIELKKENNALRELAGQKPLYPLDFEKEQL
jgi:PAS domain S-box-containing protein